MNWDAIAAIAETLGAIGVIASLVYLSIQIKSSIKQLRFSATQSIAASLDRAMEPLYIQPNSEIWVKGRKDLDSLDEVEYAVFQGLISRQLHNVTNLLEAERMGLVDSYKTQSMYHKFYVEMFNSPGAKQWIEKNRYFVETGLFEDLYGDD
jgi:hypothetical protein